MEAQKKLSYYVKNREYAQAETMKKEIEKIAREYDNKLKRQAEKKFIAEKQQLSRKH